MTPKKTSYTASRYGGIDDLKDRLHLVYAAIPRNTVALLISLMLLSFIFLAHLDKINISQDENNNSFGIWLGCMLGICAFRLSCWVLYRKAMTLPDFNTKFWLKLFIIGTLSAGLGWGLVPVLFDSSGLPPDMAIFLYVFPCGSAASIVAAYSPLRIVAIGFCLGCIMPMFVHFILMGGEYGTIASLVTILYLFLLLSAALQLEAFIRASIRQEYENLDLVLVLEQARQDSEKLNESLRHEIDQRQQIETDLRLAKQEADAANADKTSFLAAVSHEIRTPMNGVMGMASLILADNTVAECHNRVKIIADSAEMLLHMVNGLLDLSRIETGHLELYPTQFNPLNMVESVAALLQPLCDSKKLKLVIETPEPRLLNIIGDSGRIRQILLNLMNNAIKFTAEGCVSVTLHQEQHGDRVDMIFAVRDSGIGIPESIRPHLFKDFSQGDRRIGLKYGGSGLGLAISSRLARLMGGKIDFDSREGIGSEFRLHLSLPIAIDETSVSNKTAILPMTDSMSSSEDMIRESPKYNILIAEDNPLNQMVIKSILEQSGHRLTIVENGAEAIKESLSMRADGHANASDGWHYSYAHYQIDAW